MLICAAAVEQQREDDQRDHAEDHPGRAGVRAVEPGRALPSGRRAAGSRRIANVTMPTSTATANKSSRKPTDRPAADQRDVEVRGRTARRRPRRSSGPRTMKPQKVRKCATPGTDHVSSLPLAEDLGDLGPQPRRRRRPAGPAPAARCGPAGAATRPAARRPRTRPRSSAARGQARTVTAPPPPTKDPTLPTSNFARPAGPPEPPTSSGPRPPYASSQSRARRSEHASASRSTWSSEAIVGSKTSSVKPASANCADALGRLLRRADRGPRDLLGPLAEQAVVVPQRACDCASSSPRP